MARTTTDKELALTRVSVEAEKYWNATAPLWRKALRLFKDSSKAL
ncbi:hypothetical protein ABZ401_14770 [Streptomyces sp. NPDC005892]